MLHNFSRLHSIIECFRNNFFQRSMQKVLEIIEYVDKKVVMWKTHDDNEV
jgi:hypothetical protein